MEKRIEAGCLALVTWASPGYEDLVGVVVRVVSLLGWQGFVELARRFPGLGEYCARCQRPAVEAAWVTEREYLVLVACECGLLRIDGEEETDGVDVAEPVGA